MKKIKVLSTSVVLSSLLVLAACNSSNTAGLAGAGTNAATASNAQGASVYSLKKLSSYQTSAGGFRINPLRAPANQSYYFSFDSSTMRPQDTRALNIQAAYLAAHPNASIRLEGNTDDRGSREYNIGLGWRRDQSVAQLLEQQGVKAGQIQMVSYGKERPEVLGDTPQAWSVNRRVDLIYKATN